MEQCIVKRKGTPPPDAKVEYLLFEAARGQLAKWREELDTMRVQIKELYKTIKEFEEELA